MPRRVHERAARFANAVRAVFSCPYCHLETSYTEREITAGGVACRSCKRPFLPVVFHKDYLACWVCRRTPSTVHYREVGKLVLVCKECAGVLDAIVEEFEKARQARLKEAVNELRKHRGRRAVAGFAMLRLPAVRV